MTNVGGHGAGEILSPLEKRTSVANGVNISMAEAEEQGAVFRWFMEFSRVDRYRKLYNFNFSLGVNFGF